MLLLWLMLALVAWNSQPGRPWVALVMPVLAMGFWFAIVLAGGAWFGWAA